MVKDSDPAGTNVRGGPGLGFQIIGKLPRQRFGEFGVEGDRVDFKVAELRDGWAHITDVWLYSDSHPDRPLTSGWIASNFLLFDIQADNVFEQPDTKSRIVASAWTDKTGIGHQPEGHRPFACRGHWVHLIAVGQDKVEHPAWTRSICGNAFTTCDGLPDDRPIPSDTPHH